MDSVKAQLRVYLSELLTFLRGQTLQTNIILALGALTALSLAFNVLDFVILYTRPSRLKHYLHTTRGKPAWALVTGASDGIGKCLARELAAAGFNVVLHGRNEAKLGRVRTALETAFPARSFRLLLADASKVPCANCVDAGAASAALDFDALVAPLDELNLTVVVNNAGGNSADPVYDVLQNYPRRTVLEMVGLNALFPTLLLHALLPQLGRDSPALVIGVGSLSDNGLPLLSFYGAAKRFLVGLSEALGREAFVGGGGGTGVEVLAVRVGAVTGVSGRDVTPSFFEPDAAFMARAILDRVGCGRPVVVPYWAHALQQAVVSLMPSWVMEVIFREVMVNRRDEERTELAKRE